MADFQIRVTVDSSGGRIRVPAGATYAQPGSFAKGGSPEFRRALRDANRVMAREQQALVVETLDASIQRRAVSSKRLRSVTGDPRNVESDEFHYAVGREDFLDQSIAKYWRQIEEGYAGHVGRELYGFWGGTIGRINGDRVYAGRPWSRHSPRRSDMFIPATGFRQQGQFARYGADVEEGVRSAPNFARRTTIKNPIEAHHYYRDAFRRYSGGQRAVAVVDELLARASVAAWTRTARYEGRFWTR